LIKILFQADYVAGEINAVHFTVLMLVVPLQIGLRTILGYIKFTVRDLFSNSGGKNLVAGMSVASTTESSAEKGAAPPGSPPPGSPPPATR
jgi:hypothetical protein